MRAKVDDGGDDDYPLVTTIRLGTLVEFQLPEVKQELVKYVPYHKRITQPFYKR